MAIGSVMQSALSGLTASQTALQVTSNNISNVNNPDYARRQVILQERVVGGQGAGVDVAEIRRVADQFLDAQGVAANANAARYRAAADLNDRVQSLLGDPSAGSALPARVEQIFASMTSLTLDPTSTAYRSDVVGQLNQAFSEFGRVASGLGDLRREADQRIGNDVVTANQAIGEIDALNKQIQGAQAFGGEPSALIDQRNAAVNRLSQLMDLRTVPQANGSLTVLTGYGMQLVGDGRVQLAYQPAGGPDGFGAIVAYPVHPLTGEVGTTGEALDGHLGSGEIRGLMDMRDHTLPDLSASLSELAGSLADQLNSVHNVSSTVPPPHLLAGRQTGLLASDALGFTGRSTIALVNADGTLARRVDIDFDAGTVSTNGAPPVALGGSTVGDLVAGLNAALGGAASASFSGGVLNLQAAGSAGIAVAQDAAAPSSRAGVGFAQFFGLNDLVRTAPAASFATGFRATDASGFAAGQTISLRLLTADGTSLDRTIALNGSSFGDVLSALNDPSTGFGGRAGFALDAKGALTVTPAAGQQSAQIQVLQDATSRGDTGMSLSALFGLGQAARSARASSLAIAPGIGAGSGLATAQLTLDATTLPGARVLAKGDTNGVAALQALGNKAVDFAAAGPLAAASRSLTQYGSDLMVMSGSLDSQAKSMRDSSVAVQTEVNQQIAGVSGVNLDEELANMMTYQKAYAASARLIQVADQMLQDLLNLVGK